MTGLPYAQTLVFLLAAMLALTAIARRLLIPYPILLVLGGLVLSLVPGLTVLELEPDLVFLVFLPPILWAAAYFTSLRDFKQNIRPISLLALGLVLATTFAVAAVARLLMPGLGWAPALALGAIVSPPDAVAATAIGRRLAIPRRLVTILEGESLVNDASALVIYRTAVTATVTGVFVLQEAMVDFVYSAVVGVVIGLVVGWVARLAMTHAADGFVEIALTLLAPYVAWVAAEQVHASAVLACVAGGVYLRWHTSGGSTPAMRLQARAVWDQLIFLLNGVIFILIGLQLAVLRQAVTPERSGAVLWWAAAVSLTAIAVRLIWVPIAAVLPRWLVPGLAARDPMPPPKVIFLLSWVGMRGIVSLAAALSLPRVTADGSPFPYRTEIVLITFGVILATLVLQGLSLAPLVKALGFTADDAVERETAKARRHANQAALDRLAALEQQTGVPAHHVGRLRAHYDERTRHLPGGEGEGDADNREDLAAYRQLRGTLLDAERAKLIDLRNRGEISDEALHHLEHELDVEALRLGMGERRG